MNSHRKKDPKDGPPPDLATMKAYLGGIMSEVRVRVRIRLGGKRWQIDGIHCFYSGNISSRSNSAILVSCLEANASPSRLILNRGKS